MNPLIQPKNASPLILIALLLGCLPLSPGARAVVPAPDGGYPGQNTAEGQSALLHLAGGTYNTALGWTSLGFNVTGNFNTGVGAATLLNNTADRNTATGTGALLSNTIGSLNTADGALALFSNTEGGSNTATGASALYSNTTGALNTAIGQTALYANTSGDQNTATGEGALFSNNADGNTAIGYVALLRNTDGIANTASGYQALISNTTGSLNTAIGQAALASNTVGSENTVLGSNAGYSLTTGDFNVCIGAGVPGVAGESNTTRIRNIYASVANGRAVYVNSDHKLGTLTSSRRFKEQIKPMDKASEVLFALKPVSFRYKKNFDAGGAPMFGLIAEDVEQVNPDLVGRNEKGEAESVRYEQINAMLLNEFLKAHRKVEQMQQQIEALTEGLQKVNAQLEASKPAPEVAVNNP